MSVAAPAAWAPRRHRMLGARARRRALGILVLIVVLAGVGSPVTMLLVNSFNVAQPGQRVAYGLGNWVAAFTAGGIGSALWTTLLLGITRTVIAAPVAVFLAWLTTRTDVPGAGAIEALCWLGIFLPQLPLTLGWILLLDPQFGVVNQALASAPLLHHGLFDIYGFWGIVWVHLASTSIYYTVILTTPAFRRLGAGLEEAARMAGAGPLQAVRRVALPVLAPAIVGAVILSFVKSLESFEVELLLGQPVGLFVYSTKIYDLIHQEPPAFGAATALGSVFLVLLLALSLGYQRTIYNRDYTTVTGQGYAVRRTRLGAWRIPLAAASFAFFAVALAAPATFVVVGSFMRRFGFFSIPRPFTTSHWANIFGDPIFTSSLVHSLVIATSAGLAVVLVYSCLAYFVLRSRLVTTRIVDLLLWLPWALPGILVSLGFLWAFLSTPLRTLLYGTMGGIVVALVIKDSPLSTQLFKAALVQIAHEMEESARVCGASWLRTYIRIYLPLLAPTAITVWLLTFVSALRDISVPVLLYTEQSRPLAILLLEYSFSGELERGAALGVMITAIVLPVMLVARWWAGRVARLELGTR